MKNLSTINKAVFIYGENNLGKSNLFKSIDFLYKTFDTFNFPFFSLFLKFNLQKKEKNKNNIIENIFNEKLNDNVISNLISENKRIGSNEHEMIIKVSFINKENKKGHYEIRFNDKEITFEELKFQKEKRLSTIFSISSKEKNLDSEFIFNNLDFKSEILYALEKFFGKHSFIALITGSLKFSGINFKEKALNKDFVDLINFIKSTKLINVDDLNNQNNEKIDNLISGEIDINDSKKEEELLKIANELTYFYKFIYKDYSKVFYLFTLIGNKKKYELYVKYNNKDANVSFKNESNGSKKLLNVFFMIKSILKGDSVIIDEIDNGIHDVLLKDILDNLVQYLNENDNIQIGQVIATTHNTYLMTSLKANNIYILDHLNKDEEISLYNLSEFNRKAQDNNNLEKRYRSGLYGGIPYTYFDTSTFKDLIDEIEEGNK